MLWGDKDQYTLKLNDRRVIVTCDGNAWLLTSEDDSRTSKRVISSLNSSQNEIDARVILYYKIDNYVFQVVGIILGDECNVFLLL